MVGLGRWVPLSASVVVAVEVVFPSAVSVGAGDCGVQVAVLAASREGVAETDDDGDYGRDCDNYGRGPRRRRQYEESFSMTLTTVLR
jgi:hypothetical protein